MKERVIHKKYGIGRVLKKRSSGFELLVEFEDGFQKWVKFWTVKPYRKEGSQVEPSATKDVDADRFKARRIIEALRLGIVPYEHVSEFSFGRKRELEYISNWLEKDNSQRSNALAIVGEYGVGKTHLLELIGLLMLNQGWAVSYVNLDINEVNFDKPKAIYQQIVSSFRFRGGGFREFIKEVANSRSHFLLINNDYLSVVINAIREEKDTEELWEWIEGKREECPSPSLGKRRKFYKLYDKSTAANIYCYIISGLGKAAKEALGLKGFIILFDEAENIDPYLLTRYAAEKAVNTLKALILVANNDERLLEEANNGEIEKKGDKYLGKLTGLQYTGYKTSYRPHRTPFVQDIPTHIKLIFAFTQAPMQLGGNSPQGLGMIPKELADSLEILELEPLEEEVFLEMTEKILRMYSQAYSFSVSLKPAEVFCKLKEYLQKSKRWGKTRFFVKGVIEWLDILRHKSGNLA